MNETEIRAALAPFNLGPKLDGLHLRDGMVQLTLVVQRDEAEKMESLRKRIEAALRALPGVRNVTIAFTAHRTAAPPPALPGVKSIIAVASGKGGVGKSTVAVNLAVALAQAGRSVGLMDADIHGPSMPRMLGLRGKPEVRDGKMLPLMAFGVKCMSIGFLVEEETAMIWRGPMVSGALNQFLTQVEWGELDILILDMPPGTGDVQLTLAQKAQLAGAVIVSTPQDIALLDARRGVKMFEQVRVPILGLVENMSYFACPHCGGRTDIFGHGGAAAEAERIGVPFLGGVPLLLAIRETGDAGTPAVLQTGTEAAEAFHLVAQRVTARLTEMPMTAPKLTVE